MKKSEVLDFLQTNQDARGITHWEAMGDKTYGMTSYGIGLTKLRKFARSVGRDPALAKELWQSDVYEMKVISLLIDDPKTISIEQAEEQVEQLQGGMLSHVFSSCDATLTKAPFVVELVDKWIDSDDPTRICCGYGLLYEISKSKKKTAPDEDYFLDHVARIKASHAEQSINTLMSMGGALMGIGKRSKALNEAALDVALEIGPIDFDPDGRCDPMDISKHLTSDYLKEKLAL